MKTIHLLAVSIAGAMALGAAVGFGIATWNSASTSETAATTSTTHVSSERNGTPESRPRSAEGATNGPWNQDLLLATGESLEDLNDTETLVERAGVPTIVERADGSLLAAFQWFPSDNEDAFDRVAVIQSTDGGTTWTDPEPIVMDGLPDGYQRPFDPTLVLRDDGEVYLYFTTSVTEMQSPNATPIISVASSSDGVHYTYLGIAFEQDGTRLYDSAVVQLGDMWYMGTPFAPDAGQYRATSSDGLVFARGEDVETEQLNWTGNFLNVDDTVYFFGTASEKTNRNAWYATSSDMETWSEAVSLGMVLGDPAVEQLDDGTWVLIGVSGPVRNESKPTQK